MIKLVKILFLLILFSDLYVFGMEKIKDSRLLLELPDEILGTIIKCATNDKYHNIFEATKLLIRMSWVCEKLKHISEPDRIKAIFCPSQKDLNNIFYSYAYRRHSYKQDPTPFFKLLVAMGANPDSNTSFFACMCSTDYIYVIEQNIRQDNLNLQNERGETPLYFAIENDRPDIVQVLLNHGADMYIADKNGKTPVDMALLLSRFECIKLFIQHDVDTAIEYPRGDNLKLTIARWFKLHTLCDGKKAHIYREIYKLVTDEEIVKSWDEKSLSELLNDMCIIS
jgi:hypothetical protein